jgi:hypothetical protein
MVEQQPRRRFKERAGLGASFRQRTIEVEAHRERPRAIRRGSRDGAAGLTGSRLRTLLRGFLREPGFGAFLNHVRPFIQQIQEMKHHEPREMQWER